MVPRFRLGLRWLLVAVAVAAVAIGVPAERKRRFERLAARYREGWDDCVSQSNSLPPPGVDPNADRLRGRTAWYAELTRKYERAAHSPWLPVGPDPPEPQ